METKSDISKKGDSTQDRRGKPLPSPLSEARRVAALLMEKFPGKTGLLPAWIDAKDGRVLSRRSNVDELGDYVQNVAFLSPLTEDPKYTDWAVEHTLNCIRLCQTRQGLFQNLPDVDRPERNRCSPVWSLENADTVTGLASMFELTRNGEILESLTVLASGMERGFLKNGFISFGRLPVAGWLVPLSAGVVGGQFAEEWIHLGKTSGQSGFGSLGEKLLNAYRSSPYFRTHGVFMTREFLSGSSWVKWALSLLYRWRNKPDLETACLVKDNLYILFAFLESYRSNPREEIRDLVLNWNRAKDETFLSPSGMEYHNLWSPAGGRAGPARLQHNHSLIEFSADLYNTFGDRSFLDRAVRLARSWMQRQTGIGLFPEFAESSDPPVALLDPQVDMTVNLIKLHDLTGDPALLESAERCMGGVLRHFPLDFGYAWRVNADSGEILENRIETKFLGLLLKGLIATELAARREPVFNHPLAWVLFRDR